MIDLETTGLSHNPAIIELAAVHFDLSTGEELGHIFMPVSLNSCLSYGLQTENTTLVWLQKTIHTTLETSR
jgi:DNA polymerase III epsilon subunit-like protein